MSRDQLKMPPARDLGFWQRRKHDKWREVPPPEPLLEGPVADSHAHLGMLPDPSWELERAAANNVRFVCDIVDPADDETPLVFDALSGPDALSDALSDVPPDALEPNTLSERVPDFNLRFAAGVHPHNAKLFNAEVESGLLGLLRNSRASAVGEIGLDYYYDLSPREVQRDVFRRQLALAQELKLPVALHIRSSEDSYNAHHEALEILRETGAFEPGAFGCAAPGAGVLLHCCTLPPKELAPWVEAGCYVAFGGALTFKNLDVAREGMCIVPDERLLFETDAPFMTPEPMRGATCTPAHVVFTAAKVAEIRGVEPGPERVAFLERVFANTLEFYGV